MSSAGLYLFRTTLAKHTYQGLNTTLTGTKQHQTEFPHPLSSPWQAGEKLTGCPVVKEKGSKDSPQDEIPLQQDKCQNQENNVILNIYIKLHILFGVKKLAG